MTRSTTKPDFAELLRVCTRIGFLSFGGPAGQIALMHRELVVERQWVSEEHYLHALNFCHLLPGPEAQQLAIWIGWKLHGLRGGLAAGLLFVLPGALVILGLSILYAYAAHLEWFAALFLGIKAAVLAIVVQALIRIAGRALKTGFTRGLALAAFIALFFFNLPFPLVVLGAGAIGMIVAAYRPDLLALRDSNDSAPSAPRPWGETIRAIVMWGLIWAIPMAVVFITLGPDHVLWRIGGFFSQLAVVTFGGAYAVLAYMAQEAVQGYGWLSAGEMADGLGLAETTPGPLIMVTQYVGFLAAFRAPAPFSPLLAGVLGAVLTTWVTFAPCFLWIFALAPWIERLEHAKHLKGGLAALTAAVVGVIANLSLWFFIHVLFAKVGETHLGPLRVYLPDWRSFDWRAGALATLSAILIFRFNLNVIKVLGAAAAGGLLLSTPVFGAAPTTYSPQDAAAPLHVERKIVLPDVKGRIDHLAVDPGHRLLFVAEYGNGTVDVVDLTAGKVIDRIAGLHEPQGVVVADNELVVACGDGTVHFYSAVDRHPVAQLALGDDADNVRVDQRNGHVIVGYGSGALAVIDLATHRAISRTPLPGHPEGFRLIGERALVNVPDRGSIISANLDTGKIEATWPTGGHRLNFPLAIEPGRNWFAVAYRLPAALQLRDVGGGAVRSTVSACGDADDLFIDRDRLLLVCGAGHVDVLSTTNPANAPMRVTTASGARTGLFVPEIGTLFIAVPARSGQAAIWAMRAD